MEQDQPTFIARLVGVTVVVVGVVAVVALIWLMVSGALSNLAVAGPVIAAIVALGIFAAGEYLSRRRVAQQYRWDKISPIYLEFVRTVRTLPEKTEKFRAAGGAEDELPPEVVEFMGEFGDTLMLWGTPEVIKAWQTSKRLGATDDQSVAVVVQYARVLLAIRKDLGHSDRGLDTRDLLGVMVTDIDDHLPPGAV